MFDFVAPHITLVHPFSHIVEGEIILHIENALKGKKRFSIKLQGIEKSFDNYLFLLVKEGKEDIVSLHDLLYTDLLSSLLNEDISYVPHITLGQFDKDGKLENEKYEKAMKEVDKVDLGYACEFDNVCLIKSNETDTHAKIVRKFSL